MTPKQKAKDLVEKFSDFQQIDIISAKNYALICINEMLFITPMYTGSLNPMWEFLSNVKKEIELM
jgi:hypothetical protein